MKKTTQSLLSMAFLCLMSQLLYGQTSPLETESTVYRVVEEMPRLLICEDLETKKEKDQCSVKELLMFIYENLEYPQEARDEGVEGTVIIRYIVELDGTLSNIEINRDIGAGCGEEALRVVELMNELLYLWRPGTVDGEAVRVQHNLPVKFKMQ